jgi:hypothetical protein
MHERRREDPVKAEPARPSSASMHSDKPCGGKCTGSEGMRDGLQSAREPTCRCNALALGWRDGLLSGSVQRQPVCTGDVSAATTLY